MDIPNQMTDFTIIIHIIVPQDSQLNFLSLLLILLGSGENFLFFSSQDFNLGNLTLATKLFTTDCKKEEGKKQNMTVEKDINFANNFIIYVSFRIHHQNSLGNQI